MCYDSALLRIYNLEVMLRSIFGLFSVLFLLFDSFAVDLFDEVL